MSSKTTRRFADRLCGERLSRSIVRVVGCAFVLATAVGVCSLATTPRSGAADDEAEGLKLFEKRILPVLKDSCFECHSAKSDDLKGKLRVDTREGLRKGGDNGAGIVPGEPERSFVLKAMSYREDDYKMPPRGKLPDDVLADFEKWVKLGAPDFRKE